MKKIHNPSDLPASTKPNMKSDFFSAQVPFQNMVKSYEPSANDFAKLFDVDESVNDALASLTMAMHKVSITAPFEPMTTRELRSLVNMAVWAGASMAHGQPAGTGASNLFLSIFKSHFGHSHDDD